MRSRIGSDRDPYGWSIGFVLAAGFALGLAALPARGLSLETGLNFTGQTYRQNGFRLPPDTMGAVGRDHVVELLNSGYAVYRKSDGVRVASASLDGFWNQAGVSGGGAFDPRVLYDSQTDRFYAVSLDSPDPVNPSGQIRVAASKGSDPMLGWMGFAIDSDSTHLTYTDFPTVGIDREGLYVNTLQMNVGTETVVAIDVLVVPKHDLLSGTVANATLFERAPLSVVGFDSQPVVDLDGGGLPHTMLSGLLTFLGQVQASAIEGTIHAPTLVGKGLIPVPAMPEPPDGQQPGPVRLDSRDSRFGSNIVLRGGAIWAVQSVETDAGRAGIRWFEFDAATNAVLQSGLITDPALDFIFPSIAVNEHDEAVIGFTSSGSSQFASSYAVLGETADGTTRFGAPVLLRAGGGVWNIANGRFGDYSATVVDPEDSRTFWTFQEWVPSENDWAVQITQLFVVPEPSTALLLGTGLLGLAATQCRRA